MSAGLSSISDSLVSATDMFSSMFWVLGAVLFIFGLIRTFHAVTSGDSISGGLPLIMASVSIIVFSSIINNNDIFLSGSDSKFDVATKDKDFVEVVKNKAEPNVSTKNTTIVNIPTESELARLEKLEAIKADAAAKAAIIKEAAAKAAYERRAESFKKGFVIFISIIFLIGVSTISYFYLRYKMIYIKTNKLVNIDNSFENIVENIEFIDAQILKNDEFFKKHSMFGSKVKAINEKLKIKRIKFEEIIKDFEQKISTTT